MTRPGSTNQAQVQLSPEGVALVNAISKRAGLPERTIAANARVVGRHELESREGASMKADANPGGPLFVIAYGCVRPATGASLADLRLGVSVLYQNGAAARWTIVIRRGGVRLCEIDYDDEGRCEAEQAALRMQIDHMLMLITDTTFEIKTQATAIRNFNSVNGAEL